MQFLSILTLILVLLCVGWILMHISQNGTSVLDVTNPNYFKGGSLNL